MRVALGTEGYAEIGVTCPLLEAELGVFLKHSNGAGGNHHAVLVGMKGKSEQPRRPNDFVVRADSFEYCLDARSGHARAYLSYPVESWQLACPLRQLFAWLVDMERGVLLHAGAIDVGGHAVIIAGPSGSGKSSICASVEGRIFGDDWIIVNVSGKGSVDVTSLYSSVKLLEPSVIKTPRLYPTSLVTDKGKAVFHERYHEQSSQRAGALVVPEVIEWSSINAKKLDPFEAFRRIAPSTLLQSDGVSKSALTRIRRICEALPCYLVSFSLDMVDVVPAVIRGLR